MGQLSLLITFLGAVIVARAALASSGGVVIKVTLAPERCDEKAEDGKWVSVHYAGKLADGTEFDNSYSRNDPITFQIGSNRVIPGWEEGIRGMCAGEKRHLEIPPHLGYGDEGIGPIPGGATLFFDVELVGISEEPLRAEEEPYDVYTTAEEEMAAEEQLGEVNFSHMQYYGDEDSGPVEWS